jgi:serpin B
MQISALAGDLNAFAVELHKTVSAGADGNLFYSPLSISLALAQTYAGARGDTADEMREALHFTLPSDELHPAFNALDRTLVEEAGDDEGTFRLRLANALWAQDGLHYQPAFLEILARSYGAGLRLVDFEVPAKREGARTAINDWVEDETSGKITDLIAPGMLTQDTRLVIANAIYFKGKWVKPFDYGTRDGEFNRLDGSTVTAAMMGRRTRTGYAKGPDHEAASLAYRGERIEMIVVLPAPGTFIAFEAGLTPERLDSIVAGLGDTDLELSMPRFRDEEKLDLVPILKSMGMDTAFDAGRADFSGMTSEVRLFITDAVHKAYVAVDEEGTEAAAATGMVAGVTSMPMVMRVDRPFLYLIRDRESGAILFMGRVLDPTA